jgi:hypothetical protein
MGLFSKKTLVCEMCGKEFQSRISSKICGDCAVKALDMKDEIHGYVDSSMHTGSFIEESQYQKVINHRNSILEKYRNNDSITIEELSNAADNFTNISDNEARDIIARAKNSLISMSVVPGGAFTEHFMVSTHHFPNTVIDFNDVFAIAYTPDVEHIGYKMDGTVVESLICAFFTNDPYMPATFIVLNGDMDDKKFFRTKSNALREVINGIFNNVCPNLQYPIQDVQELIKQIKSEKAVKGNIEYKNMLYLLDQAAGNIFLFKTKDIPSDVPSEVSDLLSKYGYFTRSKTYDILKMDNKKNADFWYDKGF